MEDTEIVVQKRRRKPKEDKARKLGHAFKVLQAVKLRQAGVDWEVVIDEVGFDCVSKAKAAVTGMIRRIETEVVETWEKLRIQEAHELSTVESFLYQLIMDHEGDVKAVTALIDKLLKTKELKYDLLGIKSPEQIEVLHQLPKVILNLPRVTLNDNKLVDKVITVRDSSDDVLALEDKEE